MIYTASKSIDNKTKTGVMFSKLQLVCVKSVQEAVAVAVVDSKLDSALIRLIISLIIQDTSQLLLY